MSIFYNKIISEKDFSTTMHETPKFSFKNLYTVAKDLRELAYSKNIPNRPTLPGVKPITINSINFKKPLYIKKIDLIRWKNNKKVYTPKIWRNSLYTCANDEIICVLFWSI